MRLAPCMIGLMQPAILVDRLNLSAIAYAALVVMLLTPDAVAGPSFQMSVAAVAGLIAFCKAIHERLSQ
jgi:competence protein ComEC